MPEGKVISKVDVNTWKVSPQSVGPLITRSLGLKGYCVVNTHLDKELLAKARKDIPDLENAGQFYRPSAIITDGLLGLDGSATIAELNFDSGEEPAGFENVSMLNDALTEMGFAINPYTSEDLGFQTSQRTFGVIHKTSEHFEAQEEEPLTDEKAGRWLTCFSEHKVMCVMNMGPVAGMLELQPINDEEAEIISVETQPGNIIVLRPDTLSHKHFCTKEAYVLTCFFIEEIKQDRRGAWLQCQMTPAATKVNEFVWSRLEQLKATQDVVEESMPEGWHKCMNHYVFKGQRIAVRSAALRMPGSWDPEEWYTAFPQGTDLMIEIPISRWNLSDFFDEDQNNWRYHKTFQRHGSFQDGLELFDPRFFGLSPAESSGMDPQQRQVLEVGYIACAGAGYNKKKLMNSVNGVYIGTTIGEWAWVPKELAASGATGGAVSITSNRFSFCLGLKGPSLSSDCDCASAMTAIHMGCEGVLDKGRGTINGFSLAGGVKAMMYPLNYIHLQGNNLLSRLGRCFPFDECAEGRAYGEGIGLVIVKQLHRTVDGESVFIPDEQLLSIVAGSSIRHMGKSANFHTPSSAAYQDMVVDAVRLAHLAPQDVESMEAQGDATLMGDAIELESLRRALRPEEIRGETLNVTSTKSNVGMTGEAAGAAQFMKMLYSNLHGYQVPMLHLNQLNPYVDVTGHLVCSTEALDFQNFSFYQSGLSVGYVGTGAHILTHGQCDTSRYYTQPTMSYKPEVFWWPGGGGELEDAKRPTRQPSIVGTFTKNIPKAMESDNEGGFVTTFTLGENRWESFQIWLDGDPTKRLYPSESHALTPSPPQGPDLSLQSLAFRWVIDGRGTLVPLDVDRKEAIEKTTAKLAVTDAGSSEEAEGPDWQKGALVPIGRVVDKDGTSFENWDSVDFGNPGDQYKVYYRMAGKFSAVEWEKAETAAVTPPSTAEYFLVCNFNYWKPEKMTADASKPGRFTAKVVLIGRTTLFGDYTADFQILRDQDWHQVIYPGEPNGTPESEVTGPDDFYHKGLAWQITGKQGDEFTITFDRTVASGQDTMSVAWEKTGTATLTEEQKKFSSGEEKLYSVIGSWDAFAQQYPVRWVAERSSYGFYVMLGPSTLTSFLILKDCNWTTAYHPSFQDSSGRAAIVGPHYYSQAAQWVLGEDAFPGQVFVVLFTFQNDLPASVRWEPVNQAEAGEADAKGLLVKMFGTF